MPNPVAGLGMTLSVQYNRTVVKKGHSVFIVPVAYNFWPGRLRMRAVRRVTGAGWPVPPTHRPVCACARYLRHGGRRHRPSGRQGGARRRVDEPTEVGETLNDRKFGSAIFDRLELSWNIAPSCSWHPTLFPNAYNIRKKIFSRDQIVGNLIYPFPHFGFEELLPTRAFQRYLPK